MILAILLISSSIFAASSMASVGMIGGYSDAGSGYGLMGFNTSAQYLADISNKAGVGLGSHIDLGFGLRKDLSFMSPDVIAAINENTVVILMGCFVFFAVLMQLLHSMGVNVLKVIVMLGTFSLAMAFAGNDLVNFIGVPLAGYSSYCDFTASGATDPTSFMMDSLNGSAKTPLIFLVAAGAVMVFSLATSKKARHVTDTEVNLSRQNEGDEMFGSSRAARSIVRGANTVGSFMLRITPVSMQRYIDSRFQRPVAAAGSNAAAYDLIRASVNLVVSALLIALGTSSKLQLSTTDFKVMYEMCSSLADRE